jgi:hypothetical protein
VRLELSSPNQVPKQHERREVIVGDAPVDVEVAYPGVVVMDRPLLLYGIKIWHNILWPTPLKLARLPKAGLPVVYDSNHGACSKKQFVLVITRCFSAYPRLVGGNPLMLKPSKAQCSCEFIQIRNPRTTTLLWQAAACLVYFTLSSCQLFVAHSQETSL